MPKKTAPRRGTPRAKAPSAKELLNQIAELRALLAERDAPTPPVPVVDPDEESAGLRLDLGGGENPREGYESVDPFAPGAPHKVHLWDGQRWPWGDDEASALHSSHTIEHVDAAWIDTYHGGAKLDALMFFFTEAFRILKPGGSFTLVWPACQSVRAFMDPTHRRFIPREFLAYLDAEWRKTSKLDHYLTGGKPLNFKVVSAQPTIPETEAQKADIVQMQNANDHWNFFQDWIVTLNKPV